MFESIKSKRTLKYLRESADRIHKAYEKDRKAIRSPEKLAESYSIESFEAADIYEDIARIKTRNLLQQANKLEVVVSQDSSWWEEFHQTGKRYLSEVGLSELRSAIRKEKDDRWSIREKQIQIVVSLVTVVAGLVGSLAGLAAVLGFQFSK